MAIPTSEEVGAAIRATDDIEPWYAAFIGKSGVAQYLSFRSTFHVARLVYISVSETLISRLFRGGVQLCSGLVDLVVDTVAEDIAEVGDRRCVGRASTAARSSGEPEQNTHLNAVLWWRGAPPRPEDCASCLTVEGVWDLVKQAYMQRAWSALGHSPWDDYRTRGIRWITVRWPPPDRPLRAVP
jgi:hypothetical protein